MLTKTSLVVSVVDGRRRCGKEITRVGVGEPFYEFVDAFSLDRSEESEIFLFVFLNL